MQVGGTRILNAAGEYHCVATPWTQKILEGSGRLPDGLPRLVLQGPGNNIGIVENDRTEIYTHQYPTRHSQHGRHLSWWLLAENINAPSKGQEEPSFSLYHKIFRELINTLYEEKKCFVYGNIHKKFGKLCPILEAGYLIIKYDDWAANNLNKILPGHQNTSSVSSTQPLIKPFEG